MTNLIEEEVDAIVNAANATSIGGAGVDGAVHKACGPGLATECRTFARVNGDWCPTGTVRVTGAHDLTKVKHVIHTAGPVGENPDLLASCYREAIKAANENKLTSIAFPSISTGIFGYPLESAAKTAIKTVAEELKKPGTLREVRWCFLDNRESFNAYRKALDSQG
ncbi:MAG: macro domain-containing protein [Chlamydiia bacterium]|nr:macro domain-containing protein [Chlamydiia bacterium]